MEKEGRKSRVAWLINRANNHWHERCRSNSAGPRTLVYHRACSDGRPTFASLLRKLARNSRLALALAAKNQSHSGLDAAIALPIIQLPPHVAEAVEARGLIGANMSQAELMHARGIIDIDGNSNAWTGFFWKLFCKSVTLKVSSSYEQWFYKDLIPWTHYVPIAADLADLHERVDFVVNRMRNHSQDQRLKQIGEASTALIRSSAAFNHTAIGQRMLRFLRDAWPKLIWDNPSGYRRAGSTPSQLGGASVLRQVNTVGRTWQTASAEVRNDQAKTKRSRLRT